MTQVQYEELDVCRLIVKIDLGLASSWLFPSINFQFRTEIFLSIFLGWLEWQARFWEVQAVAGNVVKIPIQQRWASENNTPENPSKTSVMPTCAQNDQKKWLVEGISKVKRTTKQVNFSCSKIWWASKVSLLAIENDCVARSYRFSVPITCTRAIGLNLHYSILLKTKSKNVNVHREKKQTTHTQQKTREKTVSKGLDHVCVCVWCVCVCLKEWRRVHAAKDASSSAGKDNQGGEIESKGERKRERERERERENIVSEKKRL